MAMTTIPQFRLQNVLRRTGRLAMWAQTVHAAATALTVLTGAALSAVALDVVFSLQSWALIAVDAAVAALALGGSFYVAWIAHRNAYDPRRCARMIEQRLGVGDSRMINAVDFLGGRHDPTASRELIARSVEAVEAYAGHIDPSRVVQKDRMRRAVGMALLALAAAAAANLAFAPAFRSAMARYLHPTAENAPFTLVTFEVSVEPQRVYFGRPAAVWARLGGTAVPDQANVVFLDGKRQPLPMLRSEDGRFVLRIDKASGDRDFYVDTPSGRSAVHRLAVLPVPEIRQVTARYVWPAYTGWPPAAHAVEAAGIRALEGTTVTVTVKSNLPMTRAAMVLTPSQPERAAGVPVATQPAEAAGLMCPTTGPGAGACPMPPTAPGQTVVALLPDAQDPTSASGEFLLQDSGRFSIAIVGEDDVSCNQPLEGVYTCVRDLPPAVELVEPAEEVVVPAGEKVQVQIAARDDVAVRRIALHRGVNGWMPSSVDLPLESTGPTFAEGKYEFDLPVLGARAGDVISYYASAHDNCPLREQFTDTAIFVIRVISPEDYVAYLRTKYRMDKVLEELEEFRKAMDDLNAKRDELIAEYEKLKDKIAAQGGQATPADRAQLDQIAAKQAQYEKQAQALADRLRKRAAQQPELYDFEKEYARVLRKMADAAADRAIGSRALREELPGVTLPGVPPYVVKALDHFRGERDKDKPQQEEARAAQQDLDRLRRADEMVAQTERIMVITRQQRELADRLAQFRNRERLTPTEQIRAKRMADEQAQLERDLQDAVEQMKRLGEQNAGDLPRMSASVTKIARSVEDLKVQRDQRDAARLAEGGSGRYAAQAAESAASKLESLIRECGGNEGMMNAACDDLDKALQLTKARIAQSLQQLAQGRGIPGSGGPGTDGYYGSQSPVTVMGSRGSGDSADPRAGRGNQSRRPTVSQGRSGSPSERLNPEAAGARGVGDSAAGAMPGVPARYRQLAEAYFRRLADESK